MRGGYAPPARLSAAASLVARNLHRCARDIAPDAVASSRSASCRLAGTRGPGPAPPQHSDRSHRRHAQHRHETLHWRSEEHTSELQSLMRISYAVFCLKKKKTKKLKNDNNIKLESQNTIVNHKVKNHITILS